MQTNRSLTDQIEFIKEQDRIARERRIAIALEAWQPYFQKLAAEQHNNNQQQPTPKDHGR